VIDLDAPAPERQRAGAGARPLAVLAAVVLLLLLGGAAPPGGSGVLPEVADASGAVTSLLTRDALFAAYARAGGQVEIRATPLNPANAPWATTVFAVEPELTSDASGLTLIVHPGRLGPTTFLNAATGEIRWRTSADALIAVSGNRVATIANTTPSDPGTSRMTMTELDTGRTVWSRASSAWQVQIEPTGRLIVALDVDGRVSIYDAADGRPRAASSQVLGKASDAQAITVAGDLLLTYGATSLSALRLADLRPLWMTQVGDTEQAGRCGGTVCTVRPDGVLGLDPATGRELWTAKGALTVDDEGTVGRIGGDTVRLDVRTGRVLQDFGSGAPVGDVVVWPGPGRSWVTRLADGRVLGSLPSIDAETCKRAGDYLACGTGNRQAAVWRVPVR
jgi:outer membrane protein assembly factor BamB